MRLTLMYASNAASTIAKASPLLLLPTPSAHAQVGVNASSQDVLQHLIKADTASAFNISVGDVNVTGISQVRQSLNNLDTFFPMVCEPGAILISKKVKLIRQCNSQVSRRVLYVNVTATLGVNVPPNASPDDVRSALDVTNLSADDPIAMLAANPDRFFGRTTKVRLSVLCLAAAPQHTFFHLNFATLHILFGPYNAFY